MSATDGQSQPAVAHPLKSPASQLCQSFPVQFIWVGSQNGKTPTENWVCERNPASNEPLVPMKSRHHFKRTTSCYQCLNFEVERPKINGSPLLSRTTCLPLRQYSTSSWLISACGYWVAHLLSHRALRQLGVTICNSWYLLGS